MKNNPVRYKDPSGNHRLTLLSSKNPDSNTDTDVYDGYVATFEVDTEGNVIPLNNKKFNLWKKGVNIENPSVQPKYNSKNDALFPKDGIFVVALDPKDKDKRYLVQIKEIDEIVLDTEGNLNKGRYIKGDYWEIDNNNN